MIRGSDRFKRRIQYFHVRVQETIQNEGTLQYQDAVTGSTMAGVHRWKAFHGIFLVELWWQEMMD